MPLTPKWKFRKKTRAEIHQNPTHAEFFAPKGIAEQLVREAVQNSLDAAMPETATVRVIIRFVRGSEARAEPQNYLAELRTHLERIEKLEGQLPNINEPVSALVVEDFGTSGLEGDTRGLPNAIAEHADKNRFYYFFKNIGRSGKSAGSRGRWGLGKTVFPASSRVNTFFGFTVRYSDRRRMLMGQAQLTEHSLPGSAEEYDPYGFFAVHEGNESDYVQLPVVEPSLLDRFCEDFGIQRTTEPGLSVVVVYPRDELDFDAVVKAGILHCFYPILAKRLVLEIIDGDSIVRLDDASIRSEASALSWDHNDFRDVLSKRLDLAAWAVKVKNPEECLDDQPIGRKPEFKSSVFDSGQQDRLALSFANGDRLAVRIPLFVERKKTEPVKSFFDVFMERDPGFRGTDDQYINQGINVCGNTGQTPVGVRALLIAEHGPLATLLSDSEDVSHENWKTKGADVVTQRYERGPSTIQFVKTSVKHLAHLLMHPGSVRDTRLLRDIFLSMSR